MLDALDAPDFGRDRSFVLAAPFDPAMHPRYQEGEGVIFELDAMPEVGDEVLVALRDGRRLVRKLIAIDAQHMTLEPINGAAAVVQLADVEGAFLVVGRMSRRSYLFEVERHAGGQKPGELSPKGGAHG